MLLNHDADVSPEHPHEPSTHLDGTKRWGEGPTEEFVLLPYRKEVEHPPEDSGRSGKHRHFQEPT